MAKHETSTTYRWPARDAGLIDSIEIVRQKNGRSVAYLHANEAPDFQQQRLEARAAIRAKGWGTLSDFREGQYVLRINGLRDADDFLEFLNSAGLTKGMPNAKSQRAEKEAPKGFIDGLRANSLRWSGILYTVGNFLYAGRDIHKMRLTKKGSYEQIATGMAFGVGDALVATVGGKDDGLQLTSLLTKLKQHYQSSGIDIPDTAAIHSETSQHGKGFGGRIYDFLHRNVNVIKCLAEVVGGYFYYKSGVANKDPYKRATAIIFSAGFGAAAVIKEKKIDEEKFAAAGPLDRLWMRIQANPLMVGGISGYSNTILTGYSGLKQRKEQLALGNKGNTLYQWDLATPSVMGVANGLYAMSKKTTGGDIRTEAMVKDVYSVASQILNKQPENKREAAFESTVNFLAERPEVRGNKDEIRIALRETMVKQSQNPWFEPVALPPAIKGLKGKAVKVEVPSSPPRSQLMAGATTHVAKGVEAANQDQIVHAANAR